MGTVPEEFKAPFDRDVGLDFASKTLYATDIEEHWAELIHETAHIFASPVPPNECKTDFDFIGWELALAKELGCYRAWARETLTGYWIPWQVLAAIDPAAYTGEGDMEFCELTDEHQAKVRAYIVAAAESSGQVVNGRVVSIR